MLTQLKELQVHKILRDAIQLIEEKGLTRGMHQDPDTGEIDIEGAIMLACGAPQISILVARVDAVVPAAKLAQFDATLDLLDSASPGKNVSEWNDLEETTQEQVLQFLETWAVAVSSAAYA